MSTLSKLRIKTEQPLWLISCPEDCGEIFNDINSTKTTLSGKDRIDQLVFFAADKNELDKIFPKILPLLNEDAVCWIAYPKKSSGIVSDLVRDEGWEIIGKSGYQFVTSVSVDDKWTAMRVRKPDPGIQYKREVSMEERQTPGIDYVKRTVTLPADALKDVRKFKGLEVFFNAMSFSHKKEYVEAIEEAKKPETRQRRIDKMIEMVLKMKKDQEQKIKK